MAGIQGISRLTSSRIYKSHDLVTCSRSRLRTHLARNQKSGGPRHWNSSNFAFIFGYQPGTMCRSWSKLASERALDSAGNNSRRLVLFQSGGFVTFQCHLFSGTCPTFMTNNYIASSAHALEHHHTTSPLPPYPLPTPPQTDARP